MTQDEIEGHLMEFIQHNFVFDERKKVAVHDSLLGKGIIDSTGVLELINHLEEKYHLRFEDQELIADNFDSIAAIAALVSSKKVK